MAGRARAAPTSIRKRSLARGLLWWAIVFLMCCCVCERSKRRRILRLREELQSETRKESDQVTTAHQRTQTLSLRNAQGPHMCVCVGVCIYRFQFLPNYPFASLTLLHTDVTHRPFFPPEQTPSTAARGRDTRPPFLFLLLFPLLLCFFRVFKDPEEIG